MNSSGKVLVIFLIITAILLVSLTAISLFFFQKETERRKLTEVKLEQYETEKLELEKSFEAIKKENFLLQEKSKESEDRVNDLSDELELEKGLREEMKLEKVALEESLNALKKEKEDFSKAMQDTKSIQDKLNEELSVSSEKIKALESELKIEKEKSQELGKLQNQKQDEVTVRERSIQKQESIKNELSDSNDTSSSGVELGEIVVVPRRSQSSRPAPEFSFDRQQAAVLESVLDGRILSVDTETEFVIVSLGKQDGLTVGNVLSVYRNENYLGDIKITRLQLEMSAADLILPLSIRNIKKNDQVKPK